MACKPICKLCDRFIISRSVTFATATGLVINIPQGTYNDGEKYCILVAQAIPAATTLNATVYVTIGDSATLYQLTDACCRPVSPCAVSPRTKYSTQVVTTATGGSFRLLTKACCIASNRLASLPA